MDNAYEFILVRLGELTLKGRNRRVFEQRLHEEMVLRLKGLQAKVSKTFGRMYVHLNGEDAQTVIDRLRHVFGISSFSPALKASKEVANIQRTALMAIRSVQPIPRTFKVNVKRSDKSFEFTSQEMNHRIGSYILRHSDNLTVDVKQPDTEVMIEIRQDGVYVMSQKIQGAGGLPVGTSGRVMLMLSGGIDSPVAGYLSLKRGLRFEAVHFHSYPFTSERAKQKVVDLTKILSAYAGHVKLHIVPFTEIQTAIRKSVPEEYSITIMRRMMLRIVEKLAVQNRALGIVTGDNVGQVASQTLHSLHTINEVTTFPILRPLVTMDKLEIIEIAKEIGTYDTSILPYEDCCTIFQPKSPKTMPTRKAAGKVEQSLAVEELVCQAVDKTESTIYEGIGERDEQQNMDNLF